MEEPLKRRLVGATVIMSLVVIFVPMLVDEEPVRPEKVTEANIPEEPAVMPVQREFKAERLVSAGSISGNGEIEKPGTQAVDKPAVAIPVETPEATTPSNQQQDVPPQYGVTAPAQESGNAAEMPPASEAPPQTGKVEEQDSVDEERGSLKAWVVQVASFTNPKFARSLVDDLREKGFAAFMEDIHTGGRIWYRVVVGPEVDKQRTRDLQEAIVESTGDERLRGAIKVYP